jgi:hypothetical protein
LINTRKTELDVVCLVRLAPQASLFLSTHEDIAIFFI